MSTAAKPRRTQLIRPRHLYRAAVVAGFVLADLGVLLLSPILGLIAAGVALMLLGLFSLAGTVRP